MTEPIMGNHPSIIQLGRLTEPVECCVAARGLATIAPSVLSSATTAVRLIRITAAAFVVPAHNSSEILNAGILLVLMEFGVLPFFSKPSTHKGHEYGLPSNS